MPLTSINCVSYFNIRFIRAPLGERLQDDTSIKLLGSIGNREMTFSTAKNKRDKQMDERNKRHREERKRLIRPTFGMKSHSKRRRK